MEERPSGGGGGRDTIFNHGIDPQLRIMERLGEMTGAAHLEKLLTPLAADCREICLHFISKEDCVISCTRLHAPVRKYNQDSEIQNIKIAPEAMDPSRKRKFDRSGDQRSQRVH